MKHDDTVHTTFQEKNTYSCSVFATTSQCFLHTNKKEHK